MLSITMRGSLQYMTGHSRIWRRCRASNCLSTLPAPMCWLMITFHRADFWAWCLGRPVTVRAGEFFYATGERVNLAAFANVH
jgi:hypothetical protein